MKITKRQLRRMIREGMYRHPTTGEDLFLLINDAVDKLLDAGMDPRELSGELRGLADDVLDSIPMEGMIREDIATLTRDAIEDEVMKVLSDEGGAAGLEPIEDALEDLESEEISLPEEPIEDIIDAVPGVKRHKDGDYIDTTQLEVRASYKQLIREIMTEIEGQIICPNCGHKNSADVKKCSRCGHPRNEGNWKKA